MTDKQRKKQTKRLPFAMQTTTLLFELFWFNGLSVRRSTARQHDNLKEP